VLILRKQDNKYLEQIHSPKCYKRRLAKTRQGISGTPQETCKICKFKRKEYYNSLNYPKCNSNGWKIADETIGILSASSAAFSYFTVTDFARFLG